MWLFIFGRTSAIFLFYAGYKRFPTFHLSRGLMNKLALSLLSAQGKIPNSDYRGTVGYMQILGCVLVFIK